VIVAFAGLIAFLGLIAWGLNRAQRGPVMVGDRAPAFKLTGFDGQTFNTEDQKGKVIVVNFWASWCQPCEQEAAELEAAWQSYQAGGKVVFVGVNYVDTEPKARVYLEQYGVTYLNGPDLGTRISHDYRITGVPETYIIGPNGNLVYVKKGPFVSTAEIQTVIDEFIP
jgi:cytochrome c biogenesis protein CcmG/thiol:disulfide interchange protein DsbE